MLCFFFRVSVDVQQTEAGNIKKKMLTFSSVLQQAIGPSHVNVVSNVHVLQILGHFPTLWELGVDILEVHLVKINFGLIQIWNKVKI